MVNKINIMSIADKLILDDKNILILDTCCILDVIRCIQREKLSELKTAIEIIDVFNKGQNKFQIVLPSLINTEWSDNCTLVMDETKKHIEKSDKEQKNLIQLYKIIFNNTPISIYFSQYKLETILFDFSEKMFNLGLCIESIEECKVNAINRVVQHTPPAAQGKDSTKDCVIFEETLYLSELLRKRGFNKKIVFATSNTKEYYLNSEPIEQISNELLKFKIEIVTSLSHGFHLVQKD